MQKIRTSLYHLQTNGQCERFNSTLINMLGMLPKGKEVRVEEPHWNVGSCIQLYLKLCYRVQPLLPHVWETTSPSSGCNTLFGPTCTTMEPNVSKFVQKLREHARWAKNKAEAFQAKEAQRHNYNYDIRGRAAALEVGDTVLVCVTTFKGHH